MRELDKTYFLDIVGGLAAISNTGDFLVTRYSELNINGIVFDSTGKIYDSLTEYVYFDFTKDGAIFFHAAHQNSITATPVVNGFLYHTEGNYQHIF